MADQTTTRFTGGINFTNTSHAGVILNSLTTVQRDALTPVNGMVIYNTTTNTTQRYQNGSWGDFSSTFSRSATKVVAASDSLDTTDADYVCDGTDDDVQIQAAIDALPATGGRVLLMEGNFSIGTAIDIDKNGVTLEGQGKGTILNSASSNVNTLVPGSSGTQYYNTTIKNIYFDGNSISRYLIDNYTPNFNNRNTLIEGCYFTRANASAIRNYESGMQIRNCQFVNNLDIDIQGNNNEIVSNCYFESTKTADGYVTSLISLNNCKFVVPASYNNVVVNSVINCVGNHFSIGNTSGVNCNIFVSCNTVSSNTIIFGNSADVQAKAIYGGTIITNNYILRSGIGIYMTSLTNAVVSGNYIESSYADAIDLIGVDKSTISSNTINNCCIQTNDTYSGIFIGGTNSNYNTIIGNQINSLVANKHKYGIRENTSSDGPNIITGNICLNAVTAQISAQHASTIVSNNIEV